jgi:hypothetical protein
MKIVISTEGRNLSRNYDAIMPQLSRDQIWQICGLNPRFFHADGWIGDVLRDLIHVP